MPLGASSTATCVATLSAGHSSICAVPVMKQYSRRERSTDDGANGAGWTRENSAGVSAGGVQLVPEPAAGGRVGIFDVLRDYLRGDFYAAGVERAWRPLSELCRHVSLYRASRGRARAGSGAAF